MPSSDAAREAGGRSGGSAPQEDSIGLGPALRRAWVGYQELLDVHLADAGFPDRRILDGRVLRMCSAPPGCTISAVGRDLGITRQAAAKIVARLRERGYVAVADSATSGREKSVTLTGRGVQYLEAQRRAARTIESQVRATVGEEEFAGLVALLHALGQDAQTSATTYFRRAVASDAPTRATPRGRQGPARTKERPCSG